jgi:hypothetical protein
MNVTKKIALLGGLFLSLVVLGTGSANAAECDVAGYDGGFFIQSCDEEFKTKINVQLQPQYQAVIIEGADNNVHSFQIRRARISFKGHAFTKDLTYKFQYEAIGGKDTITDEDFSNSDSFRDAYVNYKFNNHAQLRFGQSKVNFTRDELTSSSKLQFVARSLANEVFTMGRDMGVWFHGKTDSKNFEYAVFLTNDGKNRNTTNSNAEVLFGGRLVFNLLGEHGYTQSDVKESEDHHLALGLAAAYTGRAGTTGDEPFIGFTADAAYRFSGFSALAALYYGANTENDLSIWAFHAQAGYFLVPEKFEIALRYSMVAPEDTIQNGQEFTGGLGYFFKGHKVKLQMDYSYLVDSSLVLNGANGPSSIDGIHASMNPGFITDQNDHRFRTQLQFVF